MFKLGFEEIFSCILFLDLIFIKLERVLIMFVIIFFLVLLFIEYLFEMRIILSFCLVIDVFEEGFDLVGKRIVYVCVNCLRKFFFFLFGKFFVLFG